MPTWTLEITATAPLITALWNAVPKTRFVLAAACFCSRLLEEPFIDIPAKWEMLLWNDSQEYELCREIKTIACKYYTLGKGVVTSIAVRTIRITDWKFYNDERDVYCLLVFVVSLYMTTNTNKHHTCQCIAWHFQSPLLTALKTMVQRSYKPVVSWSCHGFSFGDMLKEIEPRAGDLLRL